MASGPDMSLDDLTKKSKSWPNANPPASSSGPARLAPHPARAAPYPRAAPNARPAADSVYSEHIATIAAVAPPEAAAAGTARALETGTKLPISNLDAGVTVEDAQERLLHRPQLVSLQDSKGMDNRQWMYMGRSSQTSVTNEWVRKTDAFLELAFAKGAYLVRCPCSRCENTRFKTKVVMGKHLWKNGFTPDYTQWIYHGEANRILPADSS